MSVNPCDLHELIGCTFCSGREAADRRRSKTEAAVRSRSFAARYDGQCPACDLPIVAGRDRIVLVGSAAVAHHEACLG